MSFPVIFLPEALEEAKEQAEYLREQRTDYGMKFLAALREVEQALAYLALLF